MESTVHDRHKRGPATKNETHTTFISGCAMGVDLWAAQIVQSRKKDNPTLRLIAATPWPDFGARWKDGWKEQYFDLLKTADLVVNICDHYHKGVFQMRNEWMVDHSSRLIAYYNGTPGGTRNTIEYAKQKNIEIILLQEQPEEEHEETT